MRVVREVPHSACKITIFAWNNRYLIKLEQGLFEQTFKLNEFDLTNEDELLRIVDSQFVQESLLRFQQMYTSLNEARQRADT
jgi:hypothetical protein